METLERILSCARFNEIAQYFFYFLFAAAVSFCFFGILFRRQRRRNTLDAAGSRPIAVRCAVCRMLIHLRKSLAYTNECALTNSRTLLLFCSGLILMLSDLQNNNNKTKPNDVDD